MLGDAADGATIAQIAGTLCLSEGTVRNYLSFLHPEGRCP